MKAVVFYLLLFGYFAYLVVPDDSQITVIPLSECPFDGNTTAIINDVKETLAREGDANGPIANSRLLIHCYVDEDNADFGSSSSTEGQSAFPSTDDCSCQLFLIEGLSSKKDVDPDGSTPNYRISWPLIDTKVMMAYWKMLTTTLTYVVIVMFVIRIYQDWRPSTISQNVMPVVEVNSTDYAGNISSYLISSTSQSSDGSAMYSDRESGTDAHQPRIQDQLHRSSDFSAPRSSSRHSAGSSLESEIEISQLEKLLASGSAVIMKGSYPFLTPSDRKIESSIETLDSSYVHDIGEGLGEIYHDPQPRLLVTRSSPHSIAHPYYLHDPIFYTCTSLPNESWMRVCSLPNIHQAYDHSKTKESLDDFTAAKGQTERCDSVSRCSSSDQLRHSKESSGEDDSTAANVQYAGSVELIASGAGCERRASSGRFWESMYNIGACSDYFSEAVIYRSWPCVHPLWMFSNVESFNGLTGTSESSCSLPEDHFHGDGSIQRCAETFEAESHLDFVQGEAKNDDYKDHGRDEIKENESFQPQCIDKSENMWDNLKEEAHRQIVVPFLMYTAKAIFVEFALNW